MLTHWKTTAAGFVLALSLLSADIAKGGPWDAARILHTFAAVMLAVFGAVAADGSQVAAPPERKAPAAVLGGFASGLLSAALGVVVGGGIVVLLTGPMLFGCSGVTVSASPSGGAVVCVTAASVAPASASIAPSVAPR